MTRGFRLHSRAAHKTKPKPLPVVSAMRPHRRKGGGFVTMENCTARECRWPYGDPSPEMVMCGRESAPGKPYCAAHQALVKRQGGGVF